MKIIKLNKVEYEIPEKLEDVNTYVWFQCYKIQQEREVDRTFEKGGGEVEYLKVEDETDEFKENKFNRILSMLTNIDVEIIEEYDQIKDLLIQTMNFDLFKIKPINKFEHRNKIWTYKPTKDWTFNQFTDFEMKFKDPITQIKMMIINKENKKYDNYHRDMGTKAFVEDLPCTIGAAIWLSLKKEVDAIKIHFKFIFDPEFQDIPIATNAISQKHYELFSWEDVTYSIADSCAFNSSKGTIHGVRTASVWDVLSYLDWKKSKNRADYFLSKQKQQTTTTTT